MRIISLKCQCGHHDYTHGQDFRGPCDYQDCGCMKFSPIAGQKGLTHWADFLGTLAPNYTLCYRFEPLKFITHNPNCVNCPDCLLELKHREYLKQLEKLAADIPHKERRVRSKPRYKVRIRGLDLLTKDQLPIFDRFVVKREIHDDRNYCWICDYWGCYAVGHIETQRRNRSRECRGVCWSWNC